MSQVCFVKQAWKDGRFLSVAGPFFQVFGLFFLHTMAASCGENFGARAAGVLLSLFSQLP